MLRLLPPSAKDSSEFAALTKNDISALAWQATTDSTWLTLDAYSGTGPATVMVSADPSGLLAGTYTGNVTITADISGSPQVVAVTFNVNGNVTPDSLTVPGPEPAQQLVSVPAAPQGAHNVAMNVLPASLPVHTSGEADTKLPAAPRAARTGWPLLALLVGGIAALPARFSRWKRRGTSLLVLLLCLFAVPVAAETVEYYHTDGVGNVRVVTDEAGNVIERHDYLPFGEECTTGACASNPGVGAGQPRKFTGKERDAETGLDYFGARYYRANAGRFTTVDPAYTIQANLVDPQRWNAYAYGRNNPLRYNDPDGRAVNLVTGGIGAGIGAVAGFAGSAWAQHARGGPFNWTDAWAATAGGAVSGGLAGLTLGTSLLAEGGLGAVVAVGAGSNAVGGAVTRSLDSSEGTRPGDFKEIAIDLGVGAAGGAIGAKATGAWSGSIRQLEATEAGMREAARAGGGGSFGAARGAAGVARATAVAKTTAEITGTVVGAKTTNVAAPRIRVEMEKKE